jgi:hypothetical protein
VGESREGGGAEHSVATDRVARALALDTINCGRPLAQCTVQRITEGLYMVEIIVHGEARPERFLYAEDDLKRAEAEHLPPSGGRMVDYGG